MTLIRWSPLVPANREVASIQDEVNRLFDSVLTRRPWAGDLQAAFAPAVDIAETADAYVLRLDLPGVNQKDVKVSLLGDTITIRGERKRDDAQTTGNVHRTERVHGAFERSFALGSAVRGDQVKATYRDGVLEVHVPKAEEAREREIQIQIG